jgi:excisionase family DNA binding protein
MRIEPRFFTVSGAATYSSLSETSLRREIRAGRLTAYRPRKGRILLDRRQLDALITAADQRPRIGRGLGRLLPPIDEETNSAPR